MRARRAAASRARREMKAALAGVCGVVFLALIIGLPLAIHAAKVSGFLN